MKTISTHADAAKRIKAELKQSFPMIKFSVKSKSYSGGDSIDIGWTNGPAACSVNKIVKKYEYGKFDGMTDCYDYTNVRNDIPQTKYVFASRDISDDIFDEAFIKFKKRYMSLADLPSLNYDCKEFLKKTGFWNARQYIFSIISTRDLTNGLGEI